MSSMRTTMRIMPAAFTHTRPKVSRSSRTDRTSRNRGDDGRLRNANFYGTARGLGGGYLLLFGELDTHGFAEKTACTVWSVEDRYGQSRIQRTEGNQIGNTGCVADKFDL